MKREDFTIDGIPEGYVVYDVDLTTSGTPVVGVKSEADRSAFPLVITQHRTLIEIPEDALWPYDDRKPPLVGERYPPKVRAVGEKRVMVCRPRTVNNVDHCAWIWEANGSPTGSFHGGDDTDEVLANDEFILVFYNDEGQTGYVELSRQGLAVFSNRGEFLWGHASQFPNNHLYVWFHAAAWSADKDEVAVWADLTNRPVDQGCAFVRLDIRERTQQIFDPPRGWSLPSAITVAGEQVLVHGAKTWDSDLPRSKRGVLGRLRRAIDRATTVVDEPDGIVRVQERHIVSWKPGTDDWEVVGSFDGRLRGLPGGRFIASKPDGYTILSFD